MKRGIVFWFYGIVSLSVASAAWAVEPRYKAIPSLGWSLDRVVDLTSAGSVSASDVAITGLACNGYSNGGALTTDAAGNLVCSNDDSGAGGGHAILSATHTDSTAQAVSRGSLIYGDATPTWNELTIGASDTVLASDGTDAAWDASVDVASLTASGTVTGQVVSATAALQVGSDYINDITGSGLTLSGGVLSAAGGSSHNVLSATHTDSVANAVSRGSLIYGNSTPAWDELGIGAAPTVLASDGTDAAWDATVDVTDLTASATVTGAVVSATGALQVGSTYVNSITGAGLNSNGGALNSDGMILFSGSTTSFSANFYCIPGGDCSTGSGSDDAWTFPMSGTLTNLYFFLKTAPGVGNSWDCSVVINNTASTNLTISTGNASGEFSDTSGSEAITAGDEFGFNCLETGTATATAQIGFSVVFTPS